MPRRTVRSPIPARQDDVEYSRRYRQHHHSPHQLGTQVPLDERPAPRSRGSPLACLRAPRGRSLTRTAPEQLAQMSGIGETAFDGDVADRCVAIQ